ncbi:MAG: GIDE domain-containing protein [Gammaproteobacteria bacterium]
MSSLDPQLAFGAVLCAAAAGGGLVGFVRSMRRLRAVQNTPASRLRSAAQGYVELHGRAEAMQDRAIVARLTGEPCVWFEFRIEERRRGNKNRTRWVTVERGRSEDQFGLRDDTGTCVVDPAGAEVIAAIQNTWYGAERWPRSGPGQAQRWFQSRRFRYFERRLLAGEPLYVLGALLTAGGAPDTSARATELLRDWKRDRGTLVRRFDRDGDGSVDAQEWESAREAAQAQAFADGIAAPAAAPIDTVRRPAEKDRPFLISAKSQEQLVRDYQRSTWIGAGVFVVAGAASVWLAGLLLAR